ncbi:pro-sigmaK processing inhibitor BofA family protein [Candidatus Contubernalis alkaliaceticus]|uniref:pro-sigmaK processing inhibitor BofA family protein n=1 Tax=Candidatus Contubernalis alkaliaceticus TaxID=338645 RepID=UPI001F4C16BE|nr:pro-sigmaK processing inhibitor BofA family protein [Candidatus Contubernalis alkalaceticus]
MDALDFNSVMAFAFAALLLYLVARLLLVPFKLIVKLVLNALIGGVLLVFFNLIGSPLGFSVGINIITALVVGFLGIPGLILLIIIQFILG